MPLPPLEPPGPPPSRDDGVAPPAALAARLARLPDPAGLPLPPLAAPSTAPAARAGETEPRGAAATGDGHGRDEL